MSEFIKLLPNEIKVKIFDEHFKFNIMYQELIYALNSDMSNKLNISDH